MTEDLLGLWNKDQSSDDITSDLAMVFWDISNSDNVVVESFWGVLSVAVTEGDWENKFDATHSQML